TAPDRLALQPALGKGLIRQDFALRIYLHERNPVANTLRAVPGPMLRYEDLVAVFRREHRAGVEAHAKGGNVRPQLLRGRLELAAFTAAPELRVGCVTLVAVREAEVHAGARRAVEFVGGHVVAHPVAPVVREPEVPRLRVPVETDGVPHAPRMSLKFPCL